MKKYFYFIIFILPKILLSQTFVDHIKRIYNESTQNSKNNEISFELTDSQQFSWKYVFNHYFQNNQPSAEEFEIFKNKIYSPLFKLLQIYSMIFESLDLNQLLVKKHPTTDLVFNQLITSLVTQDVTSERQFSFHLNVIDHYFLDEYEKSEISNSYFMEILLKIWKVMDDNFVLHSEKIKHRCTCIKNMFCIQYILLKDNGKCDPEICNEYGDKQIFDFYGRELKITTSSLSNLTNSGKNIFIGCNIIQYPNFIFVNSSKYGKDLLNELFYCNQRVSANLFKESVKFYEKNYRIAGLLEIDVDNNNFYYSNLLKVTDDGFLPQLNNSSLAYLNLIDEFKYFEDLGQGKIIVVLKLIFQN